MTFLTIAAKSVMVVVAMLTANTLRNTRLQQVEQDERTIAWLAYDMLTSYAMSLVGNIST